MEMKHVVVTGANGYLGAHLVKALLRKGYFVWALVRSEESDISQLDGLDNCKIVICPLSEIASLPERIGCAAVDICYHLAWYSGSKLEAAGLYAQEALIEQSIRLMDAVHAKGCRRFIGTGSILETNTDLPLAAHKNMVYAVTKDAANKLLSLRAQMLDMHYIWCRLCGLYGDNDRTGNLVSKTVSSLLNGTSPEYSDGKQPYSFIHVEDCADILVRIGEREIDLPGQLTIAGPECRSIREYMTVIRDCIAPQVTLKFGVREDDGIRYTRDMFDNSFLRDRLAVEYRHDFTCEMRKIAAGRRSRGNAR